MITFNSQNLFASGPATLDAHSPALRTAETPNHLGDGVTLLAAGREPRRFTQHGVLVADTPAQLNALIAAIDAQIDGLPHDLVDDRQSLTAACVMTELKTQPVTAVGPRFKCDYTLTYVAPQ